MRKRSVWLAACAMATPFGAMAQTATPPAAKPASPTAPSDSQQPNTGDILVVAEVGDRQSIDRKSYAVKPGPAAETSTGVDVMRDLPSVSMDASGRIELLGNSNVKILFDGRPVPDALSILRSMSAAQILRVEVITNPSAQFPADGTAGVINIITRRTSRDGIAGTVAAGIDTRGGGVVRIAPTLTKGKWSLSTSPTFFRQEVPLSYTLERKQLAGAPDGVTNRTENSDGDQRGTGFASRTQVIFRPDEKRSLSVALNTSAVHLVNRANDDIAATDGLFAPFVQLARGVGNYRALNGTFDYRADGKLPGELFTLGVSGTRFVFDNDMTYRETPVAGGTTQSLAIGNRNADKAATLKLDYARPIGKDKLSAGASFDWRGRDVTTSAVGRGLLTPPRSQFSGFAGDYTEWAGYATYQTMIAGFKVLPGLRVQSRDYSLDGLAGGGPQRTDLFPSLFVERKLSKRLTTVVSYSRRIAWADFSDLSPVLRLQSPTYALRGDPALRPEFTDAFEARFSYAGKVHSFDLTLYDRITHDSFDRTISLGADGIVTSTPINAGSRVEEGVEAGFRGRIAKSLRYSLTGNLTAVTRDIGAIGNRRRDAQYRAKLQLDYTDGKAADPGFDQVTANLRYEGPVDQFQYRRSAFVDADVSWTHRFTPRLSLVTSAMWVFDGITYSSRTRTPFILEERRDRQAGRTFRFILTYQLSKTPQPQSQQPSAPSIPSLPGGPS